MIIGDLMRTDYAKGLPPILAKICDYLKTIDLNTLEAGKHYLTEEIVINVDETHLVAPDSKKAEFHHNNIDIQLLISGEEWIEYSVDMPNMELCNPYNNEFDYQLIAQVPNKNVVKLRPKMFMIFFPYEIHKPCCAYSSDSLQKELKKLVVKVPMNLLNKNEE